MSGWGDLILDTHQDRREWVRGFNSAAQYLQDGASRAWLDKVYRILSGDDPGQWPERLGWDYTPYNEGLILGIYGLVALERLPGSMSVTSTDKEDRARG